MLPPSLRRRPSPGGSSPAAASPHPQSGPGRLPWGFLQRSRLLCKCEARGAPNASGVRSAPRPAPSARRVRGCGPGTALREGAMPPREADGQPCTATARCQAPPAALRAVPAVLRARACCSPAAAGAGGFQKVPQAGEQAGPSLAPPQRWCWQGLASGFFPWVLERGNSSTPARKGEATLCHHHACAACQGTQPPPEEGLAVSTPSKA